VSWIQPFTADVEDTFLERDCWARLAVLIPTPNRAEMAATESPAAPASIATPASALLLIYVVAGVDH